MEIYDCPGQVLVTSWSRFHLDLALRIQDLAMKKFCAVRLCGFDKCEFMFLSGFTPVLAFPVKGGRDFACPREPSKGNGLLPISIFASSS